MTTQHDRAVLDSIFNPNLPLGEFMQSSNSENKYEQGTNKDEDEDPVLKDLEKSGIRAADNKDYETAINILTELISKKPERAASYNNRAQVYLLRKNIPEAEADANKAIELSTTNPKVASKAFTQRAIVLQLKGDDEAAFRDYSKAFKLDPNNHFAKQQSVQLNPMAALCNKMLCEMFQKIREGESLE